MAHFEYAEEEGGESDGQDAEELEQRLERIEEALGDELTNDDRDENHIDVLLEEMGPSDGESELMSVNVTEIGGSLVRRMTIPKRFGDDLELDKTSQLLVKRVGDDGILLKRL